jgi:hypothetical protein
MEISIGKKKGSYALKWDKHEFSLELFRDNPTKNYAKWIV